MVRQCHSRVKTCSSACGYEYRKRFTKNPRLVKWIKKICLNCNKEYEIAPSFRKNKKFCSRVCYLQFKSRDVKYPENQRLQDANWLETRKRILARDYGLCVFCGERGNNIHHKVPHSISGDNGDKNLITLCKKCHLYLHQIIKLGAENKFHYKPIIPDEGGLVLMLERID